MESSNENSISVDVFKSIVSEMKDQIIKEFENSFEILKKKSDFCRTINGLNEEKFECVRKRAETEKRHHQGTDRK
jgi:hypothetical protein